MTYINHITLSTGHYRRSPRAEVDDVTVRLLHPWLLSAIASVAIAPLPLPELSHYGARVIKDTGLVVTLYAPGSPHLKGKPHTGKQVPIVTLGVAQRAREAADLWAILVANFGAPSSVKRPSTPWCAVALHENIMVFPDALAWVGDLERCIAWAWITRNPSITSACCQKCGYPAGDDWLDGENCPNCKLVQP